jgi:hypothetical protein
MTGCLENTQIEFHFNLKIKHCKPQNSALQTLRKTMNRVSTEKQKS